MIFITRMDKQQVYLNPDHILSIEETPDTVITLFNGHHFIARERAQAIIDKIVSYRVKILRRSGMTARLARGGRRREQFRSSTLNRAVEPIDRDEQGKTPFHSQEV